MVLKNGDLPHGRIRKKKSPTKNKRKKFAPQFSGLLSLQVVEWWFTMVESVNKNHHPKKHKLHPWKLTWHVKISHFQ